jgi:VIT1/CCC1 family predicted Fe2+/Mn2+ transporter
LFVQLAGAAEEQAAKWEVDLEQARKVSRALLARPEQALDVAPEELGLNPDDLGFPWRAASASFLSFAVGAAIPLAPSAGHLPGIHALPATIALTGLALLRSQG